jgi:hypothetical protein
VIRDWGHKPLPGLGIVNRKPADPVYVMERCGKRSWISLEAESPACWDGVYLDCLAVADYHLA